MNETRNQIIEELFQIEKEKWKDCDHCTCLGYAIIQIAGGEDSEKGKEMEKRLQELNKNQPKEIPQMEGTKEALDNIKI
jgi:hypothetical protein